MVSSSTWPFYSGCSRVFRGIWHPLCSFYGRQLGLGFISLSLQSNTTIIIIIIMTISSPDLLVNSLHHDFFPPTGSILGTCLLCHLDPFTHDDVTTGSLKQRHPLRSQSTGLLVSHNSDPCCGWLLILVNRTQVHMHLHQAGLWT